jgi:ribosomal protein S27E
MIRRQYPKHVADGEAGRGFTEEEIRLNYNSLFIDLECPECGYVVALSMNPGSEKKCPRCGSEE